MPLSSMRKTIAKRLIESKSTIPHYYLSVDIEMDALLGYGLGRAMLAVS